MFSHLKTDFHSEFSLWLSRLVEAGRFCLTGGGGWGKMNIEQNGS